MHFVPGVTTNEAAYKARSTRSERSERSNQAPKHRRHIEFPTVTPA
jgi:hypothetical protein